MGTLSDWFRCFVARFFLQWLGQFSLMVWVVILPNKLKERGQGIGGSRRYLWIWFVLSTTVPYKNNCERLRNLKEGMGYFVAMFFRGK